MFSVVVDQIFGKNFDQFVGQIVDQIFGQGFEQGLGKGKNH